MKVNFTLFLYIDKKFVGFDLVLNVSCLLNILPKLSQL